MLSPELWILELFGFVYVNGEESLRDMLGIVSIVCCGIRITTGLLLLTLNPLPIILRVNKMYIII